MLADLSCGRCCQLINEPHKEEEMKKEHGLQKMCVTCRKPMAWRKKWSKNWTEVKYCSERCRRNKQLRSEQFTTTRMQQEA